MIRRMACCVIVALAIAAPVRADLVIGNMGEADSTDFFQIEGMRASGFTVNAGADLILETVRLRGQAPSGTSTFGLFDDGGSKPGSLLVSLTGSLPNTLDDFTLTPSSAFTLQAGTTYWVVWSSSDVNDGWQGKVANPSGPGASFAGNQRNRDGGGWTSSALLGAVEVNARSTAVPGPSSIVLLGAAAVCLGWRARRAKAVA